MRIDTAQTIAGMPALDARSLMKKLTMYGFTGTSVEHIAAILKLDTDAAARSIEQLEAAGLIEPAGDQWRTTNDGNALAMATAAKPMKRATAEKALAGVLERVEEINKSDDFLQQITEVYLFGSLLDPGRDTVGDIDLAIAVEDKPVLAAARESSDEFRRLTGDHAKRFAPASMDWFARMMFFEIQVRQHVKGKARVSVHQVDELAQLDTPSRRIWPAEHGDG